MTDASGSTQWAYDSMGRVLKEQRSIGSVTNNILYTYNLDGSAKTLTYPSGRTITYTVSAVGRPQKAVDATNNINYALNATYAPQGTLAGALLGESGSFAGITYAVSYNNRLLPSAASASSSAGNALNLTFGYYPNGNVQTVTNNLNTARTQTFTYDNLSRIATAQSAATSGGYCWGQSYGYDQYANLLSASVTKCTAPMLNLGVNANNRITNSGFSYDASGDLITDGTYTYAWDARNLLQSAAGVTHTYDGDGKRVMKSSGTLYWNSTGGTPLAETNSSGTALNEYIFLGAARIARRDSSGNLYYYFQDQVGTTKTLTNSSGVLCYDADLLPFGHEMAYTTSCAQNYKFTGLERDSETSLDQTLYRKYDSTLGRWLSPDPAGRKAVKPDDPQTWNLYAYVRGNPTTLTDPTGLYTANCNPDVKNCSKQIATFAKTLNDRLKSKNDKIRKAAEAYGALGEKNGVNVTFANVVDPKGPDVTGRTTSLAGTSGFTYDQKAMTVQQATQVTIKAGLGSPDLEETAIHEGVHVEDRAAFVNSISGDLLNFNGSLNITVRQSEINAYGVENIFRGSIGLPTLNIQDVLGRPPYSDNPYINDPLFLGLSGANGPQ